VHRNGTPTRVPSLPRLTAKEREILRQRGYICQKGAYEAKQHMTKAETLLREKTLALNELESRFTDVKRTYAERETAAAEAENDFETASKTFQAHATAFHEAEKADVRLREELKSVRASQKKNEAIVEKETAARDTARQAKVDYLHPIPEVFAWRLTRFACAR
jgi:chromosome segregation ATPase